MEWFRYYYEEPFGFMGNNFIGANICATIANTTRTKENDPIFEFRNFVLKSNNESSVETEGAINTKSMFIKIKEMNKALHGKEHKLED